MTEHTLENVLMKWESKEHSIEEKLSSLEKYVFVHVGLKEDPSYYEKKGKFFHRYMAGFISGYFFRLRDYSFILLDPLHIFDILTTFIKEIFKEPFKMLKSIWSCWTWSYTSGVWGLGLMTGQALLACILLGAGMLIGQGLKATGMAVKGMGKIMSETFVGAATSLPKKFIGIGRLVKNGILSSSDIFLMIRTAPLKVLSDARKSIQSGVSYGRIRTFKFYTNPFLRQNKT